MKKILAFCLFAFLLAETPALSQKQFYFGAGGTGLVTFITNQNNYGLSDMDYRTTLGLSGAGILGFDFTKNIGLKLELGYGKLGQKYWDKINDTAYSRNIRLFYFQLPLLFKYRTPGETVRFYFALGPQFNFLMKATQEYLKNDNPYDKTIENLVNNTYKISEETITDRFTSLDVLGRLDLGAEFTVVEGLVINTGISLGYGFLDLNAEDWRLKDSDGNYNPSHNVFGGFNVGICYSIPVGKKE